MALHDEDEEVNQLLHIAEMKEELREISEDQVVFGETSEDLPLGMEERFLEHVLAFERAEQVSHRELLARDGVALPSPEDMTEEEVSHKLDEIICAFALHRIFLQSTNHLSDRKLYTLLWSDLLDEVGPLLPPECEMNCHLDLVSSGSDEDIQLWLTYYADDADRAHWAEQFPDDPIPPHQDPPYDRDRHLPVPPEETR